MRNSLLLQGVFSIVFIGLAIIFLNPLHIWMTSMAHMSILGLLIVAFGILTILVLREQGGDERELMNRMRASRIAFLLGSLTLLAGTAWQAFHGFVDPWLLISLCFMVAGKMLARLYTDTCC